MIAVIRIAGKVGLKKEIVETLERLKLRKKYSCIVLEPSQERLGMIKKVRDFVAYGAIDEETYNKLVKERGKTQESKTLFRLHPPRGGIKSKLPFPKGVLGDNKEKINDLIKRML